MRRVDDIAMKAPERAAISGFCRSAAGFAVIGLPLWLAACSHVPDAINPVAWYRDISGNSKSDVKDQEGRNQNNLAAGGDKAYPNLATVPDEPDRVLSGIDRDKLQESLIADRNNAKYSSEQLEAGKAPSPGTASPAVASQPQTQADAAPAPAQQSAMVPPVAADQQADADEHRKEKHQQDSGGGVVERGLDRTVQRSCEKDPHAFAAEATCTGG